MLAPAGDGGQSNVRCDPVHSSVFGSVLGSDLDGGLCARSSEMIPRDLAAFLRRCVNEGVAEGHPAATDRA